MRRSLLLLLLLPARSSWAHSTNPPVAYLSNPVGVADIADTDYLIQWTDLDLPIPTGTATVELFYTRQRPPTFQAGRVPLVLEGTSIVAGIPERDLANAHRWDTRQVPSGVYSIYSLIHEPPTESGARMYYTYSPGVVRVVHPGDPTPPAVVLTRPDTPFRWADRSFVLGYEAADADGTARVKLEATQSYDGTNLMLLAEDLPAVAGGTYTWDTSALLAGDWLIKVSISDARGMSYSTFGNYFLSIMHFDQQDGGGADASSAPDAEAPWDAGVVDLGGAKLEPATSSCACSAAHGAASSPAGALPLLALLALRRRSLPPGGSSKRPRSPG